MYTVIEALTRHGRDLCLNYKSSQMFCAYTSAAEFLEDRAKRDQDSACRQNVLITGKPERAIMSLPAYPRRWSGDVGVCRFKSEWRALFSEHDCAAYAVAARVEAVDALCATTLLRIAPEHPPPSCIGGA